MVGAAGSGQKADESVVTLWEQPLMACWYGIQKGFKNKVRFVSLYWKHINQVVYKCCRSNRCGKERMLLLTR